MKYANVTMGRVEAVWNKLGGEEGVERFLRAQTMLIKPNGCSWYEANGVIYFSATSDGTTGPVWINRLNSKVFCVTDNARHMLCSSFFKPTEDVKMEIIILKNDFFGDCDRSTQTIRHKARAFGLTIPKPEVVCLIRDKFSDEDIAAMGVSSIIVMHDPIKDLRGRPRLLCVDRTESVCNLTTRLWGECNDEWGSNYSFAFVRFST